MIEVGGHTFDETLLTDGVIIDVGCRDFVFANHFKDLGKTVYSIDPDEDVDKANHEGINFMQLAISDKRGTTTYYKNGEATMIRELDPDPTYVHINQKYAHTCNTITLDDLYLETGTNIDLLKLDCEGAEYIILGESFKPIPKQISVEFHNHCVPVTHMEHYKKIVERLSVHYTMHNDVWEQRHGCGYNFWDTLFIKK